MNYLKINLKDVIINDFFEIEWDLEQKRKDNEDELQLKIDKMLSCLRKEIEELEASEIDNE